MPYKDRRIQNQYLREYRETHHEDAWWIQTLWRQENREHKLKLDKKSFNKNKKYYAAISKLRRYFNKHFKDTYFVEINMFKNISDKLIYKKK